VFSRFTGQFVAQSSEGEVMRLSETGPAFEEDGHKILARDAAKIETNHQVSRIPSDRVKS